MQSLRTMFKSLSHDDLRDWAGSTIYERGKGYLARVSQLARTEDGTLFAWVSGSDDYATSIRHEGKGEFDYDCTCPYDYGGPCKHAVAVVLAAAERLSRHEEIPLLDPEGDLYLEVLADADEEDEEWEEGGLDDDLAGVDLPPNQPVGSSPQLEAALQGKSRNELQALLLELALDFPDVARRIRENDQLDRGQTDKIVRSLRREIRRLTSEEAWYNPWKEEGNLPDYSHVEQQLRALLDRGHADPVFELGEELWKEGIEQIEEAHDEGETAMEIAACLELVLQALPRTRLSMPEQLLWLIDHQLEDEYGLLGEPDALLNDPCYSKAHWQAVARTLEGRLRQMRIPKSGRFAETDRRKQLITWLQEAYQRSGEPQKVIPLLEKEADRCRSYAPLVKTLLEIGERDRARQWCIQGFNRSCDEAPGIAADLQARLRQLAEEEGKFDLAAAYRAEDFFDRPSKKSFVDLRQAAEKALLWDAIRQGTLAYLQTGQRPLPGTRGKRGWPLPKVEAGRPESDGKKRLQSFPKQELLIEIALLEGRHDHAVSLYQDLATSRRLGWRTGIDEELAKAVSDSHPDLALQIWKAISDRLIGEVKPKAYQKAASYLRQMHKLYEQTDRLAEWQALLMGLRLEHKAKWRLMEVLDGLEKNRKLIE
ncbi:SWIM zinc finger family protein [Desulfogranum mediterraneum]|uniref:SWIM zinc finger family protein n=1 Tax=Desulfogranum mediterraneum TaxID=160661 RepID=UPI00137894A0|nr:SWIM zinc finger family protein [Desulfogranum mediterraneum]